MLDAAARGEKHRNLPLLGNGVYQLGLYSLSPQPPAGPVTPRNRIFAIVVGAIFLALIVLRLAASFLVDLSWFSALGFSVVFWTTVKAKIAIFCAVFVPTAGILYLNGALAQRLAGFRRSIPTVVSPWNSIEGLTPPAMIERLYRLFPWRILIVVASLVVAALIAASELGQWGVALRYIHQVPYGQNDPLFGMDIGFYLFSLPAYVALKDWLLFTLAVAALFAAALYWVHGAIVVDQQRRFVSPVVIAHGSAVLAVYLVVKAIDFWLDRFLLVYGDNGVVVGASYTDVHLQVPILWTLAVISLAGAVACLVNVRGRALRIPFMTAAVLIAFSVVVAPLATALYQRVYVKPNELQFEAPYMARNIAMTREAYELNNIEVKPFVGDEKLTYASLQNNRATVDNIRLWDYQPLLSSYAQLQEIRTYYKFRDADIDRYMLNGAYQQVMTSPRELEPSLLPPNAQTWVNQHLLFTHGNGVVMSPVTKTTAEGLPALYIQDIPPVSSGGPEVTEPRIYFGETTDSYIIVKGSTPEFDYPKGDKNVYAQYRGSDGVPIGGLANRLLFSWYFGDINILLSKYVTPESKIVFRRNIQQRIGEIAPFLRLDKDPYIVVSNGRLYWLQDAYTVSGSFPYSKGIDDGSANYIRNSVKVVVDAYNGTVAFYISDKSDPVVRTYDRIFPGLFQPISAMPADLHRHIRYPEDLFTIQAEMYRAYHMNTPEVFYNREDLWQFPRKPASDEDTANAKMEPYFINTRLPGEKQTEFVLMLPMVPSQRENMIAWLAARCDQPDYGKLIVYTFPKEKLVYGPYQINALINQNTDVSQQISLWNQMGSRVIHGNLLVVPIENSLLYVMPLYLRAASGQLPELKRVIAVFGGKVVMEETLAGALGALFKPPVLETSAPAQAGQPAQATPTAVATGPSSDAARTALEHYNRAFDKLKSGDLSGFSAEITAMKPYLQEMNKAKAPPAH